MLIFSSRRIPSRDCWWALVKLRNCQRRYTYKKAKDLFGTGHLGRQQQGKEAQNCSTMWFEALGFTMVGLALWVSSG